MAETELAYGKIVIDLTETDGDEVSTFFGFLSGISAQDPEILKTYWAPKDNKGNIERQLFSTIANGGPGGLNISGTLATTVDGTTICSGINDIFDAALCGTVYETMNLKIDYNFNDSPDTVVTLKDVKIAKPNVQSAGVAMKGSIVFQFGRVEC